MGCVPDSLEFGAIAGFGGQNCCMSAVGMTGLLLDEMGDRQRKNKFFFFWYQRLNDLVLTRQGREPLS